ncbi:MAG: lysylphosphatidylglycerol synthase transmembrane domain-containing protein [Candidatus Berkelbacteria bacterium]|nr:lysylphosphatidylglycerol synthase transmembrane domain-containing protein [Candidatus Berkelbacteria bacterium]
MSQPEKTGRKTRLLIVFGKKVFDWQDKSTSGKFLRIIVSAGLIIYLIFRVNWSAVGKVFSTLNFSIIFLALVLTFISEFFSIKRHQLILRLLKSDLTLWQMTRFYFFGLFASLFLPVGADISKFILLKTRSHVRLKTSVISLIWDRLIGFCGLLTILATSIIFTSFHYSSFIHQWMVWLAISFLLFLVSAFVSIFGKNKKTALVFLRCLLLSLVYVFFVVAITILIGLAINPKVNIGWFFVAVPIICFGAMLPISIGGLGVREWLYIFFASCLGLTKEGAVSVSLMLWIFALIEGVFGLIIYRSGKKQ